MDEKPKWQALEMSGNAIGVDRKSNTINGYVCAQCGDFKTPGRGKFDMASLQKMLELWPQNGLKSRFTHPNLSSDGLGKYLGRAVNPRIDGDKLRADLALNPVCFSSPAGNLGEYVMDLAETDPDAFSSSLVLQVDQTYEMDENNRPLRNDKGDLLAPHWMPTKLHASDVVDTGEAVDGFLSTVEIDIDNLPDIAVRKASEILDAVFAGRSREVILSRASAFLDRYLSNKFPSTKNVESKQVTRDIREMELELLKLKIANEK